MSVSFRFFGGLGSEMSSDDEKGSSSRLPFGVCLGPSSDLTIGNYNLISDSSNLT
jgi:hypothetical protein